MLRQLPAHGHAIYKATEEAESDQAQNDALRALVVVPFVSLFVVDEHQVSNG